jgi:UDPglucose--hexose-1-phosphate uridylyltransferase
MPSFKITKHEHRLSDGRQLIYYDDADTKLGGERVADKREPIPRPVNARMRQDPLTGEWVKWMILNIQLLP